ncbi:hypothetical protein [Saccharibacillus sacchari]|uniref:hypothetical protein n=1 Tax=Saccharibacillus sacchari TaxID=456493 RepID=UPI00056743B9|nr:hypothetical protein [Saccharibacillus sacchari]
MAKRWSSEENELFINIINDYRADIFQKSHKETIEVARKYAKQLSVKPLLHDRTEQAIFEHLTYFDELLAGLGDKNNYVIKDDAYFGTKKRMNDNISYASVRIWRSGKQG